MHRCCVVWAALALPFGIGCDRSTDLLADANDAESQDEGFPGDGDAEPDDAAPEDAAPDGTDDADEVEAEMVDPCGTGCPNDPVDGPIGGPCLTDTDCGSGLSCWQEGIDVFHGEEYATNPYGYCTIWGVGPAGCDPWAADSCPAGSECFMSGGIDPTTLEQAYACFDLCAVASSSGVPWDSNCDCRDGYQCELQHEVCTTGCSHDRQCCEVWHDGEGGPEDGLRQDAEVTLLGPDRCTNSCDPCTSACTQHGCPGGACRIGDPCIHDADCPADATCIAEHEACGDSAQFCYFPDGLCTKHRCDLPGRECPAGSGCIDLSVEEEPLVACLVPCDAGSQPGDPGFPCRNVGDPGPDAGDYACMPLPSSYRGWRDGTDASGFCLRAGNFPGGSTPLGGACGDDSECVSMGGRGECMRHPGWPLAFCMASCNEASALGGACETDDTVGVATGLCWALCWEACEHPLAPLGAASTGCTGEAMACYPAEPFLGGGEGFVAAGEAPPPGFCLPGCRSDSDCSAIFLSTGIPCDPVTGFCDIFAKH